MASKKLVGVTDFVLQGQLGLQHASPPPVGVQTLPELFAHTARKHPQHPALSCSLAEGHIHTLSYSDMATKVNQMSDTLRTLLGEAPGVTPYQDAPPVVGIWLERSLDLTLAVLAATTAGSTWLPFDPDAPVDRVQACLVDSCASLLLCDNAHYDRASHLLKLNRACKAVRFNDVVLASNDCPRRTSLSTFQRRVGPADPAYLIYTSGTTGTPKGICIPHSAALTFLLSESTVLGVTEHDTVWQGFSPAFDMWIEETWVSFCRGAHVVVGTREECRDASQLGAIWKTREISVVHAVPTLMSIVLMDVSEGDSVPHNVRLINLGGEACPASLVKKLAYPGRRIINTYGPTETTVSATWAELTPDNPVTIGRPLPSYHVLLLREDASDEAEPIELCDGCTGELAIGGPCVGLGYVNRGELTAKKFVEHPLHTGERLYRTGDLVSLDHDGSLRFLRRIDTQVKLRGFRIELGEIEACLNAQPGVQTSAVILSSLGPDDTNTCLEAYIVAAPNCPFNTNLLRQGLTTLPGYMHPEKIFRLSKEDVPRLASGKINSHGLHAMSVERRKEEALLLKEKLSALSTTICGNFPGIVKPTTSLDILLISLHSLFPAQNSLSPDADFFLDLGGHSLLAAMFVSGLRKNKPGVPNPFINLGLPDLYTLRTANALSERFPLDDKHHEQQQPLPHVSTPRWIYVACNIAQFPCMIFIWFMMSLQSLVPYYVFHFISRQNLGLGIIAAYACLVGAALLGVLFALLAKWLFLGRVTEGDHRLWGWFYFRWWFAEHVCAFSPVSIFAGTPLMAIWLRLLGAKVGKNVNLRDLHIGCAADLISIGDNVVTEADCIFGVVYVEGGMLKLRKVSIGDDAHVGAQCVLDGPSRVEDAAELGPLSMVPSGCTIPSGEKWIGCPVRFESHVPPLPPCKIAGQARKFFLISAYLVCTFILLPLFYFLPQIPGLFLFAYMRLRFGARGEYDLFIQTTIFSPVVAISYVLLVAAEIYVLRWVILGKVKPGRYRTSSLLYLRRWFIDRLMGLSLGILRAVYASIYTPPLLRALGVGVGRRTEISTARNMTHDLVEIGEESFIADMALVGDAEVRRGELILERTKIGRRAFAGNACVIPQGTQLADNTLVGVLSIAPSPDQPLREGETSFGSPPVLLPVRQKFDKYEEGLTFKPSFRRRVARGAVEAFRIFFPPIAIVYGIGICLNITTNLADIWHFGLPSTFCLLPLYYLVFFAVPSLALSVACKWLVIGTYRKSEWPMWDHRVWFSEAVTAINETLADPVLLAHLAGTAYLPACLRLYGVKIGRQVWLNTSDVTEFDCVSIGDEAQLNAISGPQTHLFEDRVMKIDRVDIGQRAVIGSHSIPLPGSRIGNDTRLESLSLVMSGESLPDNTEWRGSPVSLVRRKAIKKS